MFLTTLPAVRVDDVFVSTSVSDQNLHLRGRLRTTLQTAQSPLADELNTRFGFREFRIAGRNFELNGRRLKMRVRGRCGHWGPGDSHNKAWEFFRGRTGGGVPIQQQEGQTRPLWMRTHRRPYSKASMEVTDELGVLIKTETPLGSTRGAWNDPRLWANTWQHIRELWERDKNSPSLVMWSMENEVLHCTNSWPEMYKNNIKYLKQIGWALKSLDPTRPIDFEGDGDLDGTWEVMNLHYPRLWWLYPDLPNSAFYLDNARNVPSAKYPFRITWRRDKPLYIGEDGIYGAATRPHDFTSGLGGESVYEWDDEQRDAILRRDIDDPAVAMHVEGQRAAEVALIATTWGDSKGPHIDRAHLPMRSFIRERDSRFFAGDEVIRHINLHHDVLRTAPVCFEWQLLAEEEQLAGDSYRLQISSGELKQLAVRFTVPAFAEKTALIFETRMYEKGQLQFEETHQYWAYPRRPLQVPEGLRVAVFDQSTAQYRSERTVGALEQMGMKSLRMGTVEPGVWEPSHSEVDCLIVGDQGLDRAKMDEFRQVVLPFVEAGGVVICLRQEEGFEQWLPVADLQPAAKRVSTICWPRDPQHPVLAGISAEDLRYWRGDNVVSRGDFRKLARPGYRPIIDAGGPGGLLWSPLVEIFYGKGSIVLSQMLIAEKLTTEPMAQLLLENLLAYAATRDAQPRLNGGKLCLPESRFGDLADQLAGGLASVSLQSSDQLSQLGYIVVDADVPVDDPAVLADYVQGGGRLLLHGLTPENLPQWREMLPVSVELEEVNSKCAVRVADSPLLRGISGTELWWENSGG